MADIPELEVVLGISLLATICLLPAVWKARDPLAMKVLFTVAGFLPIIGPVILLWTANFPPPPSPAFRSHYKGEIHDRWRDAIWEKDPKQRLRKWYSLVRARDENDKSP